MCGVIRFWSASLHVVTFRRSAAFPGRPLLCPLPAADRRHVIAVSFDVLLVLDQLLVDRLLEVGRSGAELGKPVDHVLHQMEPVEVVEDHHVERCGRRALLLVPADVQVAVGPAVGQPVDQRGVSMEAKDDVLVFGEERIVVRLA